MGVDKAMRIPWLLKNPILTTMQVMNGQTIHEVHNQTGISHGRIKRAIWKVCRVANPTLAHECHSSPKPIFALRRLKKHFGDGLFKMMLEKKYGNGNT